MPTSRFLVRLAALAVLAGATLGRAAAPPAAPRPPGQSVFSPDRFVEFLPGELPLVVTAPHGGRLQPDSLPRRSKGVTDMDANTQELARALAAEFHARTGRHIHVVVSLLHRSRLDPNREIGEAAQGHPAAERAWREFHAFVAEALAAAVARHGFAFLVDLHGHSHPIPRLELGYNLNAAQLNRSDAAFDASGLVALSSIGDLHARRGGSPSALLRGPGSLGALFDARGVRAVPSPAEPQPGDHPFFAGGYIVQHHAGGKATPHVDGVQIECPRPGLRDTAANRTRFAALAAGALAEFVAANYPFRFPARP
jgi:N-formylglutamate amidohydrolase